MTNDPHYRTQYGGIDSNVADSDRSVPGIYRDALGDHVNRGESVEFPTFHEAIGTMRDRFGINTRSAYYHDDDRDEYVEVPARVVLYNPAWTGDGLDDAPQDSAAWTTASDEYTATDAMDNYGPLVAAARQNDHAAAFGELRAYRNGGQVNLDLFLPGLRAADPAQDENAEGRYVLGFETGYDYFRRQSVYASIIALDTKTGSLLRGLSDRYSSPHRGDVAENLGDWFLTMFERAETVGDTLYEVVAEARNYTVDMTTLPLSVEGFYQALGFTGAMSEQAADKVRNHRTPTAWDLYEPITWVITRGYTGKVGGKALVDHASSANDLLYAPASTERTALQQAAEDLDGNATLFGGDEQNAADVLRERAESLDEAVAASVSFRERIRVMLDDTVDERGENEASDDEGGPAKATDGGHRGGVTSA